MCILCAYIYIYLCVFTCIYGNFTHLWRQPWKLIIKMLELIVNIYMYTHTYLDYIWICANLSFSMYEDTVRPLFLCLCIYLCIMYNLLSLFLPFLYHWEVWEERERGRKKEHTQMVQKIYEEGLKMYLKAGVLPSMGEALGLIHSTTQTRKPEYRYEK